MASKTGLTEARRVNGVVAEASVAATQYSGHDIRKSKRLSPTDPVGMGASKRPCDRPVLTEITNKKRPDGLSRNAEGTKLQSSIPVEAVIYDVDSESEDRNVRSTKKRLSFGDLMDIEAVQQPAILDIDAADAADTLSVSEYAPEIYAHLRASQKRYSPCATYMEHQTDLHPTMRTILVDWLVEVAEEYKLTSETLYLSVNYVDRYLSEKRVVRHKLQLLGVSCMLLASKFEEVYAPAVDEFVYIADNTYSKREIFELETAVLGVLKFNLAAPTVKTFLRRFVKAAGNHVVVAQLANFLCELSIHEYAMIKYQPEMIAASAVSLALHTLQLPAWTPTLEHYTSFDSQMPDLQNCFKEMHALFQRCSEHVFKAVYEKYSRVKYSKVATLTPPAALPRW